MEDFWVDDWLVKPREGTVTRSETSLNLRPKAMTVLSCLARHAPKAVTKDELVRSVWGAAFVSDEVLTFNIREIRKALGDDARNPRFVRTIPKRGYQLIATVRIAAEASASLPSVPAVERQPYPGLASFSAADKAFFFGREEESMALWEKLSRSTLLAVMGPSGAGKSSFLQAGILPRLPNGWRAIQCEPGRAPFVALAQALVPELAGDTVTTQKLFRLDGVEVGLPILERWRGRHPETLLIVDQFEELFTLNPESVQRDFAELLGRASRDAGVHVLLSMRDDFLIHCHDHAALAPVFMELTPLTAPGGSALRQALSEPARACGYQFEDDELVAEMLEEVETERGALPLLAFATARLWEKRDRDRKVLTRAAYREIGGVGGALAQHADATLEGIGARRESMVREIFRNLVTSKATRVSADIGELLTVFDDAERDEARDVLGELIDARLVTSYEAPGRDVSRRSQRVEIIHESLLSAWPRLVRWQTQDADGAQLRDHLKQSAQLWNERERPDDLLWTGSSLDEIRLWRKQTTLALTAVEDSFVTAMVQRSERQRGRKRRAALVAFVALVAVLFTFGVLWQRSRNEALLSKASLLASLGHRSIESNPSAALAYARASLEVADNRAARRLSVEAVTRGPVALVIPKETWAARFSPDGNWIARAGGVSDLELLPSDGGAARHPASQDARFRGLHFNADSSLLLSHGYENHVRIWSVPEGRLVREFPVAGRTVLHRSQREDRYFAFTKEDGRLRVRTLPLDGGAPQDVGSIPWPGDFESNNSYVAVDDTDTWLAYGDGPALYVAALEDLSQSATPRVRLGLHRSTIGSVAFHPDGEHIATADRLGEIFLWSRRSEVGEPVAVFNAPEGWTKVRFSPDGSRLAASGDDGSARFWDLRLPVPTDPVVLRFDGMLQVNEASFHPGERWLVTASHISTALWSLERKYPLTLRGHAGEVRDVAFAPDGSFLASSSFDGTVRLWPLTGDERREARVLFKSEVGLLLGLDIHPNGKELLVGKNDMFVYRVPTDGGDPIALDTNGMSLPYHVAYGPRGRRAAAGGLNKIRVWDLESGEAVELIERPRETDMGVVAFTPDGSVIASESGGLRRFDLEGGSESIRAEPWKKQWDFALSVDGRFLLSAGGDMGLGISEVVFEDLETGVSRVLASHGQQVMSVALDPAARRAITADSSGVIRVGPVTGEAPHWLMGHEGPVLSLAVHPNGTWIASGGEDGTIRLWPMPEGAPLHTLPRDELIEEIRALTNLRVVEDPAAIDGYRIEIAPFPGWRSLPNY